MKKNISPLFLFFVVFYVFSQSIENFYTMPLFSQYLQNSKIDYINSRYYTKVAEAEYAYLKGEKKQAYDTLLKIEKTIPLINQTWRVMYPEIQQNKSTMYMFVELSLLNKNYVKAYQYITKLITQYGYKISEFESMINFDKMRKQNFYNVDSLIRAKRI
jgi:hypothetical protein